MYLIVSFLISAALAIPTFGASLLVFYLLKKSFDGKAMSAIFNRAVRTMSTEVTEELFHVNQGAIHKAFRNFCVDSSRQFRKLGSFSIYWGVFMHPMINGGEKFSMRVIYVPRGNVHIKAAPGIDSEILSDKIFGALGDVDLPL